MIDVKNKKVKREYKKQNKQKTKQKFKRSLNLLEEKELTQEVRKYLFLYDKIHKAYMEKDAVNKAWNEIAKKFEFLENSKVISSNL